MDTTTQPKDNFLSTSSTRIRQIPEGQRSSLGKDAGRVEAIMLVKGILDPGSDNTLISKKLADEMKWEIVTLPRREAQANRMTDGGRSTILGRVDDALIQVHNVLIQLPVYVYKTPLSSITWN